MAIAFIQMGWSTPQSATAPVTQPVVFNGAQTAGDTNIVVVGWNDTINTITSVSDTVNGAYTLIGPLATQGGVISQAVYRRNNIAAAGANANTVTVQFSDTTVAWPDVRILEYSGLSGALDGSAIIAKGSAAPSSASITTTNPTDLILVAGYTAAAWNNTPSAGFTNRIYDSDSNVIDDAIVSSVGTYTDTPAFASAGEWILHAIAFQATSTNNHLSGTISGKAGNSGALIVQKKLAGIITGKAAASGAITQQRKLAAVVTGHANNSAALMTGAGPINLAGTITGHAANSGAVKVQKAFAGSAIGHAANVGFLRVGLMRLAGAISGRSANSAALTVKRNLSGTAYGRAKNFARLSPITRALPPAANITMDGAITGALINFGLVNGDRAEILQNAQMVIKTPLGSVPLYRSFGVNQQWIGRPINRAQALIATDVLLRIALWEPRARASNFKFSTHGDLTGSLAVSVKFELDPNAKPRAPLRPPISLPVAKTVIDVSSGIGVVEIKNVSA